MHPSRSLAQFLAHVQPISRAGPSTASLLSQSAFRPAAAVRTRPNGFRGYASQHRPGGPPPLPPKYKPKPTTASRENIVENINRDRSSVGVFSPKSAAVFVAVCSALYFYFQWEKQRLEDQKQRDRESRSVGRAMVGGPFQMMTHDGKPFTEKDLLGKWSLIYFGFTNCPDICPDELDKMSAAVDDIDKAYGPIVQPIFVSVDPARDTPSQMATYRADFHPRLVALCGTYEASKAMCKAYRVYFSTPPNAKADDDYLVDHSIFFYLMDPDGKFVEAFGKSSTKEDVVDRVKREVDSWKVDRGTVV